MSCFQHRLFKLPKENVDSRQPEQTIWNLTLHFQTTTIKELNEISKYHNIKLVFSVWKAQTKADTAAERFLVRYTMQHNTNLSDSIERSDAVTRGVTCKHSQNF